MKKQLNCLQKILIFGVKNEIIYSFCNGVAGLGLSLKYFEERDINEASVQYFIKGITPLLYKQMIVLMKSGKYSFLHGAIEIAHCCYKNEHESLLLDDFLDELSYVSIKTCNGVAWYSTSREKDIILNVINLSLSHGLAGIFFFMRKICTLDTVLPLLRDSVRFIINQQQDQTIYNVCSPTIVSEILNYRKSRFVWCNGDLGTAYSFMSASNILNNNEYRDIDLKVLLHCTQRNDIKKDFVQDAGVCHGSAGIAHIFNRVYQTTGDDDFKEAALYWLDDCINKSCFNDGLAGYKVWRKYVWITIKGILEGIAGIGLVLLAAISDIEPDWDECLLLS